MNITVNENRTVEKKYTDNEGSQNENRITELTFTLPAIYDDFVHKIVFITEDGNYTDYIEDDNTYTLKNNVTKYRKVKSYVWLTDSENNKDFRSELFDLEFNYNEDPSDYIPSEEEKSQIELLMEELDEKIQEVTALEENVYTITETDTLLAGKLNTSLKGANNGLAELDSSGKIPSTQLPSYVDDVLEYNSRSAFPVTGESGKIYVAKDTNKTYRWSGTDYVEISESLALGETSSTAYRGDRGKIAYDHATDSNKVSSAKTKKFYKVGVTAEGHISEVEEVAKSDLTALGVEDSANKVTVLDDSNTHYPSSGAVKTVTDGLGEDIEDLDDKVDEEVEKLKAENTQQQALLNALYQIAPKTDYEEGTEVTLEDCISYKLEYEDDKVGYGDTEQESTEGYQLIPYTLETLKAINTTGTWNNNVYTFNGITYIIEEENGYIKEIKTTGTATSNSILVLISTLDINAGTYYVSGCPNGGSVSTYFIYAGSGLTHNTSDTPTATTLNEDVSLTSNNLRITIINGTNANNLVWKPMLSKTNTTDFEPYTGNQAAPNPSYPFPVKTVTGNQNVTVRGINLLDESTLRQGSWTSTTQSARIFFNSNYYLKQGTYTIVTDLDLATFMYGVNIASVQFPSTPSIDIYDSGWVYNTLYITFTTTADGYLGVGVAKRNGTDNISPSDISNYHFMVYEGAYDSSISYEPYYTPITKPLSLGNIELCKIGNYQDYIWTDRSTKKWYKHSEIGRVILNGTEDWVNSSQYGYPNVFFVENLFNNISTSQNRIMLSTHFTYGGAIESSSLVELNKFYMWKTLPFRLILGINYTQISELKTWLSNNNTKIIYPLATPTDTEITDTTLISQLEEIYNLASFNGTTIIEIDGDLPMPIKVRSLKNISTNSLDSRISLLEE